MADRQVDLSLSRTFVIVDGRLDLGASSEQALALFYGAYANGEAAQVSLGLVGTVVDSKYKVLALLGEGGMGSVYRVLHLLLNKEMALKTFRTAQLAPDAWGRFQREAQAIAKLTHANIVQVFDFGIVGQNFPFYTMELLVGESLADRLELEGRLTIEESLRIFTSVADGMAHAHRQGIVHRDIKPANIFMEEGKSASTPKIVDFGLAKLATNQCPENQGLTSAGLVFGSPLYMSPEQSMGIDTDQRTDIYSFGCSLFQGLTGRPPFVGKNALATVMMHQQEMPPRLVQVAEDGVFPARLEAIVARLLAKDAKKRYQTFEEVSQDLAIVDLSKIKTLIGARAESLSQLSEDVAGDVFDAQEKTFAFGKLLVSAGVLALIFIAAGSVFVAGKIGGGPAKTKYPATNAVDSEFILSSGPRDLATIDNKAMAKLKGLEIPRTGTDLAGPSSNRETKVSHKTAGGGTVFEFPLNNDGVGLWSADGVTYRPVTGPVTLLPGRRLFFRAGKLFSDNPALFRHFAEDDLEALSFVKAGRWTTSHLAEASKLKSLRHLFVAVFDLNAADLQYINQLPDLMHLQVSGTPLTGDDLLQLTCLTKLDNLEADYLLQMTPAIMRLRQGHIHSISLKSCDLTDDDLKQLSAIPTLACISIDHNKFSSRGLQFLSLLPELNTLRMGNNKNVGPDVIQIFASGFKKLRSIRITTDGWTPEQKAALTRALHPDCIQEPPGL